MKYFTDNPLERIMMETPKQPRQKQLPELPEDHHCYGCNQYGNVCVFPCYRDLIKQWKEKQNDRIEGNRGLS